ncbi:Diphthamide biosynthesis protein 2, partial [Serendipita sp. 399]
MQSTSANAFSSNGEAAITRSLDLDEQANRTGVQRREDDVGIDEFYEIDATVAQIQQHHFRRIALQFPDEMLRDSVAVYLALGSRLKATSYFDCNLFVLADTSYGSCCTDEVAAQHVNADVVIHYGHACLSATTRLPTIYIYGKRRIDMSNAVDTFRTSIGQTVPQSITLRTDVSYNHAADGIVEKIRTAFPDTDISKQDLPRIQQPRQSLVIHNDVSHSDNSNLQADSVSMSETVLFIGPESLALTNLLMTKSSAQVYRYDPVHRQCNLESARTNKLLMRRYAVMQRARDADVFGILVGTLGVASYLHLITEVRKMLTREGKKTYTIS